MLLTTVKCLLRESRGSDVVRCVGEGVEVSQNVCNSSDVVDVIRNALIYHWLGFEIESNLKLHNVLCERCVSHI